MFLPYFVRARVCCVCLSLRTEQRGREEKDVKARRYPAAASPECHFCRVSSERAQPASAPPCEPSMSYNGGGYGQYGHGGSNRYGDSSSYRDRSGGFGGSSRYGGGGGGGRRDTYRDRDSLDYIKLEKPDFSDLPPFEKRFYHEHPAVTARTEQEIEDYRRLKQIHVSGKGVPRPVSTFEEASFPSEWVP